MPPFTESLCDATNKPKNLNTTANNATNCKFQYEYLVAVVAKSSNSSVLLQLNSYQLDAAIYLQSAFLSLMALVGLFLY